MSSNGNGSLHLLTEVEPEHDTLPPGCPPPYLCDGLQGVIVEMGVLRAQLDRIEDNQVRLEANLGLVLSDVRRILLALNLGVKPT